MLVIDVCTLQPLSSLHHDRILVYAIIGEMITDRSCRTVIFADFRDDALDVSLFFWRPVYIKERIDIANSIRIGICFTITYRIGHFYLLNPPRVMFYICKSHTI